MDRHFPIQISYGTKKVFKGQIQTEIELYTHDHHLAVMELVNPVDMFYSFSANQKAVSDRYELVVKAMLLLPQILSEDALKYADYTIARNIQRGVYGSRRFHDKTLPVIP